MTQIETEPVILDEESDGLIRREYAADLTPGEGRTVDCRIVPYGETIEHNDGLGGVPKGMPYREEWMPGAFTHQLKAANRVLANLEHQEGIAGIVGHGTALIERQDGLYGSFKLHDTPEGNKALMLIKEGIMDSVSLEAEGRKSLRGRDGVIRRVKANLVNIAFARFGAYAGAAVLAVRQQAAVEREPFPEELMPSDMDPAIIARCRALGVQLPERYEAHLADTDTSAETDTSEADTRQT
jgi:HK97 family phage prohead protease